MALLGCAQLPWALPHHTKSASAPALPPAEGPSPVVEILSVQGPPPHPSLSWGISDQLIWDLLFTHDGRACVSWARGGAQVRVGT